MTRQSTRFQELETEHQEQRIGPLIYEIARRSVERLLSGRDLSVYAEVETSVSDAALDVTQSFVERVLLGEGQIDYIFTVARDEGAVERLIRHHARRYLARTRKRTVIDNIFGRCVEILADAEHVEEVEGGGFLAEGSSDPSRRCRREDVRRAASISALIPKLETTATVKAPRLFDRGGLKMLLEVLFRETKAVVLRSDLQDFLKDLLAPWDFGVLGGDVSDLLLEQPEVRGGSFDRISLAILATLEKDEHRLLVLKFAGQPDRVIAEELGISRQMVGVRKAELWRRLEDGLVAHDESAHADIISAVCAMAAQEERP